MTTTTLIYGVDNGHLTIDYKGPHGGDYMTRFSLDADGAMRLRDTVRELRRTREISGEFFSSSSDFPGEYGVEGVDVRAFVLDALAPLNG